MIIKFYKRLNIAERLIVDISILSIIFYCIAFVVKEDVMNLAIAISAYIAVLFIRATIAVIKVIKNV